MTRSARHRTQMLYIEPCVALQMLRQGDIDAIVAVEGKPVQWVAEVNDPNLRLVPVDYAKPLREDYLPAQLTSADYPNLVSADAPVDTIAGEAILASYNWPVNSDRYRRLSLLVDAFFSKIALLQKPPYHPKWEELAARAPVAGWTRFRATQEWLDRDAPAPAVASASVPARPQDRDAMFREFIKWQATHPNGSR